MVDPQGFRGKMAMTPRNTRTHDARCFGEATRGAEISMTELDVGKEPSRAGLQPPTRTATPFRRPESGTRVCWLNAPNRRAPLGASRAGR
jgi:hypothetical protein